MADSDNYHIAKFYMIRTDEDFPQNDLGISKKSKAANKLNYTRKPLTRSLLLTSDAQANKEALRNFRSLLQWCGDSNCQFPVLQAQDIVKRGLEQPNMCNEIYMQCIKQCTRNPKSESLNRCWLLLCLLSRSFPSTETMELYLLNFFLANVSANGLVGNYARLCLVQLEATISLGATWFTPTTKTIQLPQKTTSLGFCAVCGRQDRAGAM